MEPTVAPCHCNELGARTQSQLVQNMRDVISNRLFVNHQSLRNCCIAQTLRDQNCHLLFAFRECVQSKPPNSCPKQIEGCAMKLASPPLQKGQWHTCTTKYWLSQLELTTKFFKVAPLDMRTNVRYNQNKCSGSIRGAYEQTATASTSRQN